MPENERKTEALVERRLRRHGYFASSSSILVERQQSDSPRIRKLLANASKRGNGIGYPEFIIHSDLYPEFLIVVECKANPRRHESSSRDRYGDFAVDGVLLYASFLSKEFDVLAIAITGQDEATFRISHHYHLKGAQQAADRHVADDIISLADYYQGFIESDVKFRQDYDALIDYGRILNDQLQAKKITESERGFLISGILIALQNAAFKDSFRRHRTGRQLAGSLQGTIAAEFENAQLPEDRREGLKQAFSFITSSPPLTEAKEFFVGLIEDINNNINGFMRTHKFYDVIGQFYVEFLRYANNDKGLGIVLTPPHVADLFAELGNVNKNSIVFDNCCGTAGLLITAMSQMLRDAGDDRKTQEKIKNEQLLGIEYQSKIYALAVSNMVLHGDGKTNIYRGDCFVDAARIAKPHKPTVGLLNPPYKNKRMKEDKEELEYVLNNLDCLQQDGKCVAIVPITCATAPSGEIGELKRRLLQRHTLEAVMSMPIELFHNSKTTVVTCIMVFTANRPHPKNKKTWFGYWRDDGLVKTKHRGRIDLNDRWATVKEKWLSAYRNREVAERQSTMVEVGASDEWCVEAYLEPDYLGIDQAQLKEASKRHMLKCAMLLH